MYKATAEMRDCAQVPASLLHVLEDLGRRLSRIESTLSENARREEQQDDVFQFGEGKVSRRKFAYISKRNRFVRLSPRELTLLEIFAERRRADSHGPARGLRLQRWHVIGASRVNGVVR